MRNVLQGINTPAALNNGVIMQFQVPRGETWFIISARPVSIAGLGQFFRMRVNEKIVRDYSVPSDYGPTPIFLTLLGGSYFTLQTLIFPNTAGSGAHILIIDRTLGG